MINYLFKNFAQESYYSDKSLWYKLTELGAKNG